MENKNNFKNKTYIFLLCAFLVIIPSIYGVINIVSEEDVIKNMPIEDNEEYVQEFTTGKKEELRQSAFILQSNTAITSKKTDMKTPDIIPYERTSFVQGGSLKLTQILKDLIDVEIDFGDGRGTQKEQYLKALGSGNEIRIGNDKKVISYKCAFTGSFSVGIEIKPDYTYVEAYIFINGDMNSVFFIIDKGLKFFEKEGIDYLLTSENLLIYISNKDRNTYEIQYPKSKTIEYIFTAKDEITIENKSKPSKNPSISGYEPPPEGGNPPQAFDLYDITPNPHYNGSVYLSWSQSLYADKYDIYYKPSGGSYTKIKNDCYNRYWSHVVTGTIDTTYYYYIRAENVDGTKDSDVETVVMKHTPPPAPTLSIYAEEDDAVWVMWTRSSQDASYTLYRYYTSITQYTISEATEIYDCDYPSNNWIDGVYFLDSDEFQGIYNFKEDQINQAPLNWTVEFQPTGTHKVIGDLEGAYINGMYDYDFDTVYELYDNDGSGRWYVTRNTFTNSTEVGYVEFWMRSEDVSKRSFLKVLGDGPSIGAIGVDEDKFYVEDSTGIHRMNISQGYLPVDKKWYNFGIGFNTSDLNMTFFVDGNLFYVGEMMNNVSACAVRLETDYGDSGYKVYFDSISPSWEKCRNFYYPWYVGATMDRELPERPVEGKYYYAVIAENEFGNSPISNNVDKTFDFDLPSITELNVTYDEGNNSVYLEWTNMTESYPNRTVVYSVYESNTTITSLVGLTPVVDWHTSPFWQREIYRNETLYFAVTCGLLEEYGSRIEAESNGIYSNGTNVTYSYTMTSLTMPIYYENFWNVFLYMPKTEDLTLKVFNLIATINWEIITFTGVTANWYVYDSLTAVYFHQMLIALCGDYIMGGAVYKNDLISMYFAGHSPLDADWWYITNVVIGTPWYITANTFKDALGLQYQDGKTKVVNYADAGFMVFSCFSWFQGDFIVNRFGEGYRRYSTIHSVVVNGGDGAFYGGFTIGPRTKYIYLWLTLIATSLVAPTLLLRSSYYEMILRMIYLHEAYLIILYSKEFLDHGYIANYYADPFWTKMVAEAFGVWAPLEVYIWGFPYRIRGGIAWRNREYRAQNYLGAGTLYYRNQIDDGIIVTPLPCPTGLFWWYHDDYPVVDYNTLVNNDTIPFVFGLDIDWITCAIWTWELPY